jgi:cation transport ATPase
MAPPLLTLQGIELTISGKPLLEGAELSVSPGERLALVGRNGSGKSTLLRIAAGQTEADKGVRFFQPDATVRYLPQEPDLGGFQTVLDYVEAGLGPGDEPYRARYLLDQLGLTGDEDPSRLSGGEARRAAITGGLIASPFLLSMGLMLFDQPMLLPPEIELALASLMQFWLGARFYRGAWKALRSGAATMDVLVALGTSAAYGLSLVHWSMGFGAHGMDHGSALPLYFESSSMVIAFVLLGKWLEERAMSETASALRGLQALQPDQANRIDPQGHAVAVPINQLATGDRLLIKAGERIACDGLIIEGGAGIDESMVTGESLPVTKAMGDTVIGGTLNTDGLLVVQVTALGADSVLALRLVSTA